MKNAPIQKSNESARVTVGILSQGDLFSDALPVYACITPNYPPSRASATAHVLALLIEGRRLTSHDVLFECGSSRAAAIIERLANHYHWPIETEDWTVGTSDGRVASIARYFFKPETIERAYANGAGVFIEQTKQARARLRLTAPEKRQQAAEANTKRSARGQA